MMTINLFSRDSKRRKHTKRAKPSGFRLTKRDQEIVAAVYAYRALATPQIAALFFNRVVTSRCIARLRFLYDAGFLQRIEQPQTLTEGRKPLVYVLDKRGAALVADHLGLAETELDWTPTRRLKQHFLDHLLGTNDVRIAITQAATSHSFTLEKWLDDAALRRKQMKDTVTITGPGGGTLEVSIVPDGYFALTMNGATYDFFVEADRGTVTGKSSKWAKRDWARKVAAYVAYYKSGKYQARYHTSSYRILTVTTTDARLATLKQVTEQAGGKSWFWFTTFTRATADDILTGDIWQIANRDGFHTIVPRQ